MGNDIEKKLTTQTGVENKSTGNLINDKRTSGEFYSSEEIGVIEVNWKGLFKDCKYAWITVGVFMMGMLYGVSSLSSQGYFDSRKIDEEKAKVKIVEVTNYFGKKILISGEITNYIPIEVRLPQKCVVDPRWIGSEVELVASRFQSNQSKVATFQFSGVENLCDSTEGYLKAKAEKEKMKELVNKISEEIALVPSALTQTINVGDKENESVIKNVGPSSLNIERKKGSIVIEDLSHKKENNSSSLLSHTKTEEVSINVDVGCDANSVDNLSFSEMLQKKVVIQGCK